MLSTRHALLAALATPVLALGLTLALLAAIPAHAGITGMNPADAKWQSLHYTASRGIASLTVDINLSEVKRSTLIANTTAREGLPALAVPSGPVWALQSNIHLKHLFGDYSTDDRLWFQPADAAVVEREKIRSGSKQYIKSYRYDGQATHRLRIRPDGKNQRKKPAAQWSDRDHSVYPYGNARKSCKVVSEPGALFYVAAAHDFSDGKAIQLCVFSDSALFHMNIKPVGRQTIEVNYALTRSGKTRQVKGHANALRLNISAQRLPGFSNNADFEVLDFKGDQTLFIDPKLRIPLRISGSLQGMGKGDVDLSAVTLR